ncbi:NAD(P)/FAD-dependent oxidoreductase [Prevotella sp. 10(H)]|uniref:NAD(P)/FAD-dependent oxidoreductase n=1 Tax=Prevotella sp. 10(H) TaxID=1158294 RepID=UPI0004A6D0BD|nr:geranylgeranyl reductase family protein [Prevotella sp. 10(H)]
MLPDKTHIKTIIIGAGPAGISCGYTLLKNGSDCLIIDRKEFPREKICGGGLTPQAHAFVDRIFNGLNYDYMDIRAIKMFYRKKYICSYSIDKGLRIVSRRDFDYTLLKEYEEKGGQRLTDIITKIEEEDDKIYLSLLSGKKLSCDYLIGADGANSIVRKYLQPDFKRGFLWLEKTVIENEKKDLQVYFDNRLKNGYLYKFPNPRGYVVGYGDRHTNTATFDKLLKEYDLMPDCKTKGAYIPMFDKQDYPFRKNILLAGDAGGYVDSITGEGLYFAFKSGENAALSIIQGKDYKQLNQPLMDIVKRRKRMARLFYFPPVHRLFIYLSGKPKWLERINRRVNRELSN